MRGSKSSSDKLLSPRPAADDNEWTMEVRESSNDLTLEVRGSSNEYPPRELTLDLMGKPAKRFPSQDAFRRDTSGEQDFPALAQHGKILFPGGGAGRAGAAAQQNVPVGHDDVRIVQQESPEGSSEDGYVV